MTHIHPFRLFVFLLLCCTRVITFAQSDSYQTIPESLRGYWQYKTENVSDWNGPLIGENFVENAHLPFCGLRDILTKTERSASYEGI